MPVPAATPESVVTAVHDRPLRVDVGNVLAKGAIQPEVAAALSFRHAGARALMGLVWIYQRTVSPVLPAVFGPACGCRFHPTCSRYAMEALRTRGAVVGCWLTLRRLLKCTPLHAGGLDPVPPAAARYSGGSWTRILGTRPDSSRSKVASSRPPPRCTRVTA